MSNRREELEAFARTLFEARNRTGPFPPRFPNRERLRDVIRQLRDIRAEEKHQQWRIVRSLRAPIGGTVYEVNRWRWHTDAAVDRMPLKVWARLPNGDLLVSNAWSDAWSSLRPISYFLLKLPRAFQTK